MGRTVVAGVSPARIERFATDTVASTEDTFAADTAATTEDQHSQPGPLPPQKIQIRRAGDTPAATEDATTEDASTIRLLPGRVGPSLPQPSTQARRRFDAAEVLREKIPR